MSIFESLGQGDIWSLGGMQFESPVRDILDKESFSLDELLREDDLLQEIKCKNSKLIEYLASEEQIECMINYMIVPPPADCTDDLIKFKYPYVSCEIFCCELDEILRVLIGYDNKFLKQIFSILDSEAPVDNYLAGYFEKLLEMLFRRTTIPVISYINNSGRELFLKFLSHIDNYSVSQIIQRLMLPHIPFVHSYGEMSQSDEERQLSQCNWSLSSNICELLCSQMLQSNNINVATHISDLLITILQLSPADTLILFHICQSDCLDALINAALSDAVINPEPNSNPYDHLPTAISLAAILVLESILIRLCEPIMPYGDEGLSSSPEESNNINFLQQQIKLNSDKVCAKMVQHMSKLSEHLAHYIDSNPHEPLVFQTKTKFPRLGQRGLQLVKFVEALVRLNEPAIDEAMCIRCVFQHVIDLMFAYELNSLLHLSVQHIIIMILDGGDGRKGIRKHVLVTCNMIQNIMKSIINSSNNNDSNIVASLAGARRPILGHLIVLAQTISQVIDNDIDSINNSSVQLNNISINGSDSLGGEKLDPLNSSEDLLNAEQNSVPVDLKSSWGEFVATYLRPIIEKQAMFQGSSRNDDSEYGAYGTEEINQFSGPQALKYRTSIDDEVDDEDDDDDDDDDDVYASNSNNSNNSNVTQDVAFQADFSKLNLSNGVEVGNFATFDSPLDNSVSNNTQSNDEILDPFANNSSKSDFDPFSS